MAAQRRAENLHRLDSIILLTYITVLIVIVLTSWLFKHYRFKFVHETGLTLLYGLLIGFVIRYFDIGLLESQTFDVDLKDKTIVEEPPDYLRLEVKSDKGTPHVSFHYELMEGFYADKKKHNEQKIEQKVESFAVCYIHFSVCDFENSLGVIQRYYLFFKSAFSPEIFFNIMLPPIIFNAGYSLKKRHFFRNIGSILVFAFVGTTVSCFATGSLMYLFTKIFGMGFSYQELLFFGAVISATDPVTVISLFAEMHVEADLFALVFGESALNDAVAMVLSSTIDTFSTAKEGALGANEVVFALGKFAYIFFGSLLLGSLIGCGNALITKMTAIAEHPLLESSLFVLVSYVSFLIGEVVGLTGIVSVLFCGISQAHYTFNNLSDESKHTTKQFFQMISYVLESFIFCYVGVSIFVSNNQKWNLGFLFFSLIICSTTAAIVMVTVFVNGGLTAWMVDYLGIKHGCVEDRSRAGTETGGQNEVDDLHMAGTPLTPSGSNPWDKAFLPRKWYNFDANFMKPLLTHATPSLEQTLPPICLPFSRMFTSARQSAATNASNESSPCASVQVVDGTFEGHKIRFSLALNSSSDKAPHLWGRPVSCGSLSAVIQVEQPATVLL
ncbi:unnamed protein product [Nippostrongylus brasiliensis]|uniref:Sodium/hydrogen exchanger n=1 Tax=Nippostrongylus brasiliensis TaxID=27835 RepID=A0A0N4XVS6_NIPBR|nr:unnamed protein product [Nippostrongylus brasiliensis]